MGVYIKSMEMPTRCWDCLLNTYGYCMASDEHSDIIPSDAPIPEWCPLVSVPKHGRLIDADALFAKIPNGDIEHDERISRTGAIADVCTWVLSAPTILPADKEDKA